MNAKSSSKLVTLIVLIMELCIQSKTKSQFEGHCIPLNKLYKNLTIYLFVAAILIVS